MQPIITENMDKAIMNCPLLIIIIFSKNRTTYVDINFSLHFDPLNNIIIYFSLYKIQILFLHNLSIYVCKAPY